MRCIVVFIFLLLLAEPSIGQQKVELQQSAAYTDVRIREVKLILQAANDFWAANPNIGRLDGHSRLKRLAGRVPGLRSILAIGAGGDLKFDSYNFLAWPKNLKHRKYFRKAEKLDVGEVYISLPVTGLQSGQVFIPVSTPVYSVRGKKVGVLMASLHPSFFLPQIKLCDRCWSAVYLDGKILASYPQGAVLPAGINIEINGAYGTQKIIFNGITVDVHWQVSADNKLTYLFTEAAPPAVD